MIDRPDQFDDLDARLTALHIARDVAGAPATREAVMRRIDHTMIHPRRLRVASIAAAALLLGTVGLLGRHFATGTADAPVESAAGEQMLVVRVQRVDAAWLIDPDADWMRSRAIDGERHD